MDSDSEYSSSSSSEEEVRPSSIKITKGKKAKINEVVQGIVEKEKAKRQIQNKKSKDKKIEVKTPLEPPKPDSRDEELIALKQSLEELKAKFNTPPPVKEEVIEAKPKRTRKPKVEEVEEKPKKKETPRAIPQPIQSQPFKLSRDDILRSILFN